MITLIPLHEILYAHCFVYSETAVLCLYNKRVLFKTIHDNGKDGTAVVITAKTHKYQMHLNKVE